MLISSGNGVEGPERPSRFWIDSREHVSWQRFTSRSRVEYTEHVHSEFNIVVCLKGSVEVEQCGVTAVAAEGEALIGNASVAHRSTYSPDGEWCKAVSLTVHPSLFRAAAAEADWRFPGGNVKTLCLGKVMSGRIHSAALEVHQELDERNTMDARKLRDLAMLTLGSTVAQWPRHQLFFEVGQGTLQCLPRWQFVRAHEFMAKSAKSEFNVRRIARELGICTSRFYQQFRSAAGLPPAQYFEELVLREAARLMTATTLSVKEISYEIGFRTPSHFCAAFRRRFGVSPMQFRLGVARPSPA